MVNKGYFCLCLCGSHDSLDQLDYKDGADDLQPLLLNDSDGDETEELWLPIWLTSSKSPADLPTDSCCKDPPSEFEESKIEKKPRQPLIIDFWNPPELNKVPSQLLYYPCFDLFIVHVGVDIKLSRIYRDDILSKDILASDASGDGVHSLQAILSSEISSVDMDYINTGLQICTCVLFFVTENAKYSNDYGYLKRTLVSLSIDRHHKIIVVPIYVDTPNNNDQDLQPFRKLYYTMSPKSSNDDHFRKLRDLFDKNKNIEPFNIRQRNEKNMEQRRNDWVKETTCQKSTHQSCFLKNRLKLKTYTKSDQLPPKIRQPPSKKVIFENNKLVKK